MSVIYLSAHWMRPDIAGWSSLVARRAHNPEVVGSNPAPATKIAKLPAETQVVFCYLDNGIRRCPTYCPTFRRKLGLFSQVRSH